MPLLPACCLQADEKRKVKLQVSMNLHGLVAVESAALYEEEEYEEAVPVQKAAPPVANGPAAAAEGGEAPMEAEPAAAAEAAGERPSWWKGQQQTCIRACHG